ncbi:MAG: polyprenyl synthetase family protein, partial [Myxococcota bacterium]
MNSTTTSADVASLTAAARPSADFSALVERALAQALQADGAAALVAGPVSALAGAAGAKRARPWLVSVFGSAAEVWATESLVDAAVGVELIHTASLLHDDVVDEATERRGQPAANVRFGNTRAVLAGDWALTCALEQLGRRLAFLRPAIEVVARMTRAIAVEVEGRRRLLPLDDWEAMARGKTGSLFGLCGRLAGLCARDEDRAEAFARCGEELGLAFQLADDIADLSGVGGKGRFNDLRTGSPSYPVLWAAARDARLGADLLATWQLSTSTSIRTELEALGSRVIAQGAVQAADEAARRPGGPARR